MERRAIFIFIIVLVSSVISFSIDEKGIAMLNKAKGMIDYGVEIGEDSLLKDAIRILNEFIVLYPREHKEIREAYLMIGDAYYAMKQFSNAVDYYDKAIKTYPVKDDRYHYAVYSMAFSYYKMGKYDKAMEMFKALYGTEYEGEARVNVGSILIEMGDFKKAISELSKVSSKDWKPYASYYLGVAYERIGLISEAVMEFKESAKTSKDDDLTISSLYKAVEILLTVGKLNEAYDVSKELFDRYGQGKSDRSFEIALLHSEVLYRMRLYTQGLTTLQFELKRMVENYKKAKLLRAMGWFYYRLGRMKEAEKSWHEAMNLGDKEEKYLAGTNLAELYRELKKNEKALEIYEYLENAIPEKSDELAFEKIKVLIDMGNYDKALSKLNSLRALYPFETTYWISQVYRAKGDLERASKEAKKLLTIAKKSSDKVKAYFLLGDIEYQAGNYKSAREYYEKILSLGKLKDKMKAQLNLGMIYYTLRDYSRAIQYFKEVQKNAKVDMNMAADAVYYLAETMLALGRYEEAQNYYKWLEKNDISGRYTENAMLKSIWILIDGKEYDKALKTVEKYLGEYEGKIQKELIYMKGEILLKMGRITQAYNTVKDLVVSTLSDQSASGVLYIMAKYFETKGDMKKSSELYERIVSDYPHTAKAPWAALDDAMMYYRNGRYEEAKKLFFNVVTGYPDFEKVDAAFYYIGRCYEALNEKDKAMKVYREFLKKFPTSSRISEVKERLENLER